MFVLALPWLVAEAVVDEVLTLLLGAKEPMDYTPTPR